MVEKYCHNTFFLVRHGEAETTVTHIVSSERGARRYHLTERGRRQVAETAEFLADKGADFIVSSLITRARETAEIMEARLKIPLSFDPRLGETRMGSFEDKPRSQFLDCVESHGGRLHSLMTEGIEGYVDIRERVRGFLTAVNESFTGKKIVVVSHGDPIQEMYGELLGIGSEQVEAKGGWYPEKGACMRVAAGEIEEFIPQA